MTPKQARFVEEYLVDMNATQAAIRAGYSIKTACAIGGENLRKPIIAAAIVEGRKDLADRTGVTQERIIEEYRRIAFADLRDLFTWDEERCVFVASGELTEERSAVISGVKARTVTYTDKDGGSTERIELELKTYDKLKALNDLARHLGMFVERFGGPNGEPLPAPNINVYLPHNSRDELPKAIRDRMGVNGK